MTGSQTCTVYPWCAETGPHTVHASAYTVPDICDGNGDWILPANLMTDEAGLFVGWLGEDLTPAMTRARVAELRRHLDAIERLADLAEGGTEPKAAQHSTIAPGDTLGLDGKRYPPRVDTGSRAFLSGRVHYLHHDKHLSVRQIVARLSDENGVTRSVGWVSSTLKAPCEACVQVATFGAPEHPVAGGGQ